MIATAPTSQTPPKCTHCGLPVPLGLVEAGRETQFCCSGCRGAYRLIHRCGLQSFYGMAHSNSADDTGDLMSFRHRRKTQTQFSEFDSQAFLDKFASTNDRPQIKLALDGIHCAACVWLIEKLPQILPGVLEARVNWARATVNIRWDRQQVKLSAIAQTLYQLGYPPYPIRENERAKRFSQENRKHIARLGIAAALAGNNMIISAAMYFGMFAQMSAGTVTLMRIVSCVLGAAALAMPGRTFLKSAMVAVKSRTPHMDLPIALALIVGTVVGTINVIRGSGEIYFDSLSVLIFLLLIGRWLQFRQQAKAADAVDLLYRLTPKTTLKITNGVPVETLVDLVANGDQLQVNAGELVPVDGVVMEGESRIDESILTGESAPVLKTIDDSVFAGTVNQSSAIMISATAVGEKTRLSKIAQLVEDSGTNRPKIVKWANQIGGYFVLVLMVLAAITFGFWMFTSIEVAVERTMALLIVACPCALALATPLVIAVSLGKAAKKKIMVKHGDVLQSLQQPGIIWLDKTGTITTGHLHVQQWCGDRAFLPWVQTVCQQSQHPVSLALSKFTETSSDGFSDRTSCEFRPTAIEEKLGLGMVARSRRHRVLIGNRKLIDQYDIEVSTIDDRIATRAAESGFSPCWVAVDDQIVAIAVIGDAIRDDSIDAIKQLKQHGWQVGILSGDHQAVVDRVAKRLQIDPVLAAGDTTPEMKLKTVQQTPRGQTVVMVGDGVNDSAALAAATVGIAVKGGAEASLAAAHVYLAKAGLEPIVQLLNHSRQTNTTLRRNLLVSLTYNITFAGLAFAGAINPFVAAILMPLSSLTVASLSFGLVQRTR